MQIRPIRELTVFDVTNHRASAKETTLSMCIDGLYIYSLSIDGKKTVSSGANTVGAFRNDKDSSILAWLDPVSGEFLKACEISALHPALFLPPAMVLLVAKGGKYLGLPEDFPVIPALIISVLVSALIFAMKSRKNDNMLENNMRAALSDDTAPAAAAHN